MRLVCPSILLALTVPAHAATLTVGPSGAHATIRAAVQAAAPGDVIEVEAGTYDEEAIEVAMDLEIVGLGGSGATLWNGPAAMLGFSAAPALVVSGGAVVTLRGLDLSGRSGQPSLRIDGAEVVATDLVVDDQDAGFDLFSPTRGAIQVTNGTLSLDACALEDNRADHGGAIWAEGSTVTLTATLVARNEAAEGGAIRAVDSDVLLDGCQIEGNEAEAGGAVHVRDGTLETQSGSFSGNSGSTGGSWGGSATNGGAILATGAAQVTLVGTTFDGNSASSTGGALRLDDASLAIVDGAAFLRNTADFGGAVYVGTSGGVQILGSLFDGNAATGNHGGAIRYRAETGSSLEVLDSLLRGNTAAGVGGAIATSSASEVQAGALVVDGADLFDNEATSGGAMDVQEIADVLGTHLRVCGNVASGEGGGVRVTNAGDVRNRWSNSVFTENSGQAGGGLYLTGAGPAEILNDSFLGNDATSGGGLGIVDTTTDVVNTLVAYTAAGDGLAGPAGAVTVTYSAFWSNVAADLPGALASGAGNVFADPLLTSLTPDGDCTNDEPWPLPGSPLVDAGAPTGSDPDGSRSDIGAYGGPDASWDDLADNDQDGFPGGIDCDDADPGVNPGADEVCNGVDDDCSGLPDDGAIDAAPHYRDGDGDGWGVDGDSILACEPPPGYAPQGGDCDDELSAINPGASEFCNGLDDDCDGAVDDGVLGAWYPDADADGYGADVAPIEACEAPSGHVDRPGDCDDADAEVNPDAADPEGDGIDANCDGADGVSAPDAFADEPLRVRSGCGCAAPGGASGGALGLLLFGLLVRRARAAR